MSVSVDVGAKVNLSLQIMGIAPNGYHLLDMLTVSSGLADTVTVTPRTDGKITCEFVFANGIFAQEIPPENNSAVVAARLICDRFSLSGADINIVKRIPFSAGLGGSSADAAGVIAAFDKICVQKFGVSTVPLIASQCGSDVPGMLVSGFKRVRGTGNEVEILSGIPPVHTVIIKGKGGVSSAECYHLTDELCGRKFDGASVADELVSALKSGDWNAIKRLAVNDLYPAAVRLNPSVATSIELLYDSGANAAVMTGSGSACVGLFCSQEAAEAAARLLRGKIEFVF